MSTIDTISKFFINRRRLIISLIAFGLLICILSSLCAIPGRTATESNTKSAQVSRDKMNAAALRSEIQRTYKLIGNMSPKDADRAFAGVVGKYISIGMTFNYAEHLLKDAGFTINTDPFYYPSRSPERHDQTRAYLVVATGFLYTSSLLIDLIPSKSNDFSSIGRIDCRFVTDLP